MLLAVALVVSALDHDWLNVGIDAFVLGFLPTIRDAARYRP